MNHQSTPNNASKMTTMKRSYQHIRKSSDGLNDHGDSSTQVAPILIELEDDASRNSKRPRKNDTLLNLLIRAIVEEQIHSRHVDGVGTDAENIRDTNSSNDDSTTESTITSSTAANSPNNEMDSSAATQIVDRIPLDDRSLSHASSNERLSPDSSFSPLPNGRPLMAPPRLPSHFVPGQVRFIATNSKPLKMTQPCLGRYTKTTGQQYNQAYVP
jgi:hypothetical protein